MMRRKPEKRGVRPCLCSFPGRSADRPLMGLNRAARRHVGGGLVLLAAALSGAQALAQVGGCARCGAAPPAAVIEPQLSFGVRTYSRPLVSRREAGAEFERSRRSARRVLHGLRPDMRRRLLSRHLFRRRQPRRQPGGGLSVPVPQRGCGPLLVSVRRHDRQGRVIDRRALRRFGQCAQIRAGLRRRLLVPPAGAELGRDACRRRGEIWSQRARHPGDAGEIRPDVPAGRGSQGAGRPDEPDESRRRGGAGAFPARLRWTSTPMAWTPASARPPPRSAGRRRAFATTARKAAR